MSEPKVVYLILVHTDAKHLEKLTNTLSYKARIFIHLDKKTEMSEAFSHITLPQSAEFIKERVKVYWGGISMIRATLNLIEAALASGENFSHLVLLSGLDYPIKPPQEIYTFLTSQPNRQFIRFIDLADSPVPETGRLSRYWFMEPIFPFFDDSLIRRALRRLFESNVLQRKLDKDRKLAFGSQWWAITPECATYILKFVKNNPYLWNLYKYSHAPDEHFFHTIVANSPYIEQAGGFSSGIKWPHHLSNLHIGYLNKMYCEENFEYLKESDKFFARKFSSEKSSKLIDLIDAHFNSCPSSTLKTNRRL